jgi:Ca2+-binding RTX toxin-like protein
MPNGTQDPFADFLVGFWDFAQGKETDDTGLADGIAQDGRAFGDAFFQNGTLHLDGRKDYFVTKGDDTPFDLTEATIQIKFSQGCQPHRSADILLNRGEFNDRMKDGYFVIGATGDGRIEVTHMSDGADLFLRTDAGLFDQGDDVVVTYAFSEQSGGTLVVENKTTGAVQSIDFDTTGLTLITDDDDGENFTFGAREVNENAHSKYFNGTIESVAVYNLDIINSVPPTPDGIVSGTAGDDLIDLAYTGDPDGDRVDAGDAILPGQAPDDDIIDAGDGDDTILAGLGDDTVLAGDGNDIVDGESGDDLVFGGAGDDLVFGGADNDRIFGGSGSDELFGEEGDDELDGGEGDDFLSGGDGNDTLRGGPGGRDFLFGGADRDVFADVGAGDLVDGGGTGDDFDTLDLSGSAGTGSANLVYTSPDRENGFVNYFDSDGNFTGTLVFRDIENIIPICFTPGTLIATPKGEVPVEDLRPGDKVITRDNGLQEISWRGARGLTTRELAQSPHLRPIRIRKGALGRGLPERDMLLSPNHRVLVSSDKTALYFEESEVLVAAKHLTALNGIDIVDVAWTTYIHVMFERHEVILSDGAWTESFQPGDYSLQGIGNAQRLEIQSLFPELATDKGIASYQAARRSLKRYEAKLLTN